MATSMTLLVVTLLVACFFEFINGFHDTANAVATVIYTNSLRPWIAVIWSGICNFFGLFLGGVGVALSITKLLPTELLVTQGQSVGMAMMLALLTAAILWNFGTWYLGIPCSSSHTLIGAIIGVGLTNSFLWGEHFGQGLPWGKVEEVGLSLLISPLVGFIFSGLLLLIMKRILPDRELYTEPHPGTPPPWWIRLLLIGTCTGVSLAHGSNDGQKGVGLVMLILIGALPINFALNLNQKAHHLAKTRAALVEMDQTLSSVSTSMPNLANADSILSLHLKSIQNELKDLLAKFPMKGTVRDIPPSDRWKVRRDILLLNDEIATAENNRAYHFSSADLQKLKNGRAQMRTLTDYAPSWVMLITAISLGLGTMVGWKRIVVTIGEKIGKQHLTYAQGASAELVAMSAIGLSSYLGMPVSTTHVLSSGVAGTMEAQGAGLQMATINRIASAWVLTLPASILLSGLLFPLFLWVLK